VCDVYTYKYLRRLPALENNFCVTPLCSILLKAVVVLRAVYLNPVCVCVRERDRERDKARERKRERERERERVCVRVRVCGICTHSCACASEYVCAVCCVSLTSILGSFVCVSV